MILAGIGMEGAEAAGDLFSSDRFAEILANILPKKPNSSAISNFEILLKIRAVDGTAKNSQVVAYRVVPG